MFMSLAHLSKEELVEKFEQFLFNMTNCLEQFEEKSLKKGYHFDYGFDSLSLVEKYIVENEVIIESDDYNDISSYCGEVLRKNIEGSKWICNLDEENNSLYYGFPVIEGHSIPNVLFSPFHIIRLFILRKKPNLIYDAIASQLSVEQLNGIKH